MIMMSIIRYRIQNWELIEIVGYEEKESIKERLYEYTKINLESNNKGVEVLRKWRAGRSAEDTYKSDVINFVREM